MSLHGPSLRHAGPKRPRITYDDDDHGADAHADRQAGPRLAHPQSRQHQPRQGPSAAPRDGRQRPQHLQPRQREERQSEQHRERGNGNGNASKEERGGGGQAFSVPTLPDGFDGTPMDGGQYLATVRQQAALHAPVYRVVRNPYAAAESSHGAGRAKQQQQQQQQRASARGPSCLPSAPSAAWRSAFTANFRASRAALQLPCTTAEALRLAAKCEVPEEMSEAKLFHWIFGYGMRARKQQLHRQQVQQMQQQQAGIANPTAADAAEAALEEHFREPTTGVIRKLDQDDILKLLELIPNWLVHPAAQQVTAPSSFPRSLPPLLSRWAFALLLHLSDRLDGDEVSVLRELARTCGAAIARSRLRFRAKVRNAGLGSEGAALWADEADAEEEGEEEEMDMDTCDEDEEDIAFVGGSSPGPDATRHPSARKREEGGTAPSQAKAHNARASAAKAEQEEEREEDALLREEGTEARSVLAQLAEEAMQAESSAWIVIAAVCVGWGQSDLWDEIRDTLGKSTGAA